MFYNSDLFIKSLLTYSVQPNILTLYKELLSSKQKIGENAVFYWYYYQAFTESNNCILMANKLNLLPSTTRYKNLTTICNCNNKNNLFIRSNRDVVEFHGSCGSSFVRNAFLIESIKVSWIPDPTCDQKYFKPTNDLWLTVRFSIAEQREAEYWRHSFFLLFLTPPQSYPLFQMVDFLVTLLYSLLRSLGPHVVLHLK